MAESTREIIEELRKRLLEDQVLYSGFLSSIESALREAKPYMGEHALALMVLNRVIGE